MGLLMLEPGEAEKVQLGIVPERARDDGQDHGRWASPSRVRGDQADARLGEGRALIEGVKIVGAATLNDLALDAGATMWF